MKKYSLSFNDFLGKIFDDELINLADNEALGRTVTIQVTEQCNLVCSYCYQGYKTNKMMTKQTGKAIVDLLFQMWDKNDNFFINKKTKGLVLEFIGGEPFLNIEVVEYICDYFFEECLKRHHPWLLYTKFNISSNGTLYFNKEVQNFINKYKKFLSLNISIDGPKEIHDSCRVYPNGQGSFDQAHIAEKDFMSKNLLQAQHTTKITISPTNLKNINEIVDFFIQQGKKTIFANTVYEANWDIVHSQIFYNELKKMADYLLQLSDLDVYVSLFEENFFIPKDSSDLQCWCGGAGKMLAFDSNGIAYPCIRFMETSLGNDAPPVVIGDTMGIYITNEAKKVCEKLQSIDRRTKSDDECFHCSIASGCADCEAWNYQSAQGQFNIKNKNICWMHRARALANYYFWNKYYIQNNINKRKQIFIEENIALQIISKEEWDMLNSLLE